MINDARICSFVANNLSFLFVKREGEREREREREREERVRERERTRETLWQAEAFSLLILFLVYYSILG